jgi:hypothetical protein
MLLRAYLVATTLLLLLGARRRRLSAGEVSLVYYTMGPRRLEARQTGTGARVPLAEPRGL